ncbi:MAG TPA: phytanoyl-CoA dioxygenase family protein, partial [Caldilineaceae bacterium]|nr:phytanoyl-CoA dioxygenase family protein [Caldilineaceae bacterium]
WHPDGSNLDYARIKVAFYLDPVSKETGCLRVIPGSHRPPLHEDLKPLLERRGDASWAPFSVLPPAIPAFPLESQPGDVVFFNQNLWHSAFGGRTGRRMFTLNVAAKPVKETQIEYLQRVYHGNLKNIQNMQHTQTGRVYTDAFLHSDRPRIQSMVGKLVELGFQ